MLTIKRQPIKTILYRCGEMVIVESEMLITQHPNLEKTYLKSACAIDFNAPLRVFEPYPKLTAFCRFLKRCRSARAINVQNIDASIAFIEEIGFTRYEEIVLHEL